MRNLNDELRKLDEYNYNVSPDFSKKVMKKIHRGHFGNSIKYVVSFASVAAVACFAVVLYSRSDLKDQFFANKENSSESLVNNISTDESVKFQDMTDSVMEESSEKDNMIFDSENNLGELNSENEKNIISEDFSVENKDNIANVNSVNSLEKSENTTSGAPSNTMEQVSDGSTAREKQKDLLEVLEKAGYKVEESDDGLKVKATKQDIIKILDSEENLIIEEKDDYVIIKLK